MVSRRALDGETRELFASDVMPLGLTADAERPPAEEIMSIGGAHGARRGTGPTYLDRPLSRGVLYLILQNRIGPSSRSGA